MLYLYIDINCLFSYEPEFVFDVKHQFYKYYASNSGNKVFEDNLQVLVFVEIDGIFEGFLIV
jgi:hypothetical protein